MKLQPIKREVDHITAYRLTIGSKEAREAGLVGADGELYDIEKTVSDSAIIVKKKDYPVK